MGPHEGKTEGKILIPMFTFHLLNEWQLPAVTFPHISEKKEPQTQTVCSRACQSLSRPTHHKWIQVPKILPLSSLWNRCHQRPWDLRLWAILSIYTSMLQLLPCFYYGHRVKQKWRKQGSMLATPIIHTESAMTLWTEGAETPTHTGLTGKEIHWRM